MKIAVMPPYFFPDIGYFQLMNAVDEFVICDDVPFTKKGWINRNRILVGGADVYISAPLRNDADHLDIRDRFLAASWPADRAKMLGRIELAYAKAPHFDSVMPLVRTVLESEEENLFGFLLNSLRRLKSHLELSAPLIVSSSLVLDASPRQEIRVKTICRARGANELMSMADDAEKYRQADFTDVGIELTFLKATDIVYSQKPCTARFVPGLSIIDVMMFNGKEVVAGHLNSVDFANLP